MQRCECGNIGRHSHFCSDHCCFCFVLCVLCVISLLTAVSAFCCPVFSHVLFCCEWLQSRTSVLTDLNNFHKTRFEYAQLGIVDSALSKIVDGDVLLTYARYALSL